MGPDEWFLVFTFLETMKDGLALKNVCKDSNIGFYFYIKSLRKVYPKKAFIIQNKCMYCDKCYVNSKIISYPDIFPPRIMYSCKNLICFSACLNTFLSDMCESNMYPFYKLSNKLSNNLIYIDRTNGGFSIGKVYKHLPIIWTENEACCTVIFGEKIYKNKYHVFLRSLRRQEFSLSKLVPIDTLKTVTIEKMFLNYWNNEAILKINRINNRLA